MSNFFRYSALYKTSLQFLHVINMAERDIAQAKINAFLDCCAVQLLSVKKGEQMR